MTQKLRNVVIEYKGGGFDGNWWQWNYFGYDSEGKWYNIYSSGYKGITSEDDFPSTPHMQESSGAWFFVYRGKPAFIYRLDNPKDVLDLVDNMNAGYAIALAKAVEEHTGYVLKGTCECCGNVAYVKDMNASNWMPNKLGVGGSRRDLFCSESCAHDEEEEWAAYT